MSSRFEKRHSPYQDRGKLQISYVPDTLVGRENELDAYENALYPIFEGEEPNNIFLYGKTGVGKTAAARYLLRELKNTLENDPDIAHSLNSVYVNCEGLRSSYRVAVALLNETRTHEHQINESGYSTSEIYHKLWAELDPTQDTPSNTALLSPTDPDTDTHPGETTIVILDEIDHIQDGEDSILYQLSRAKEIGNVHPVTKLGIVGISNDLTFTDRLSPKVRSSLCERRISFPVYDATELNAVLSQRADLAFRDDAVDDGVVQLCAAYGAKQDGDARKAIKLLRESGDVARERDSDTVSEHHLEAARDRLQVKELTQGVEDMHEHDRHLLYAVATLAAEGNEYARTRDIYPRYERICELAATDSFTMRSAQSHLNDLRMLGYLNARERNEGSDGGKYRQYSLKHSLDVTLEALSDTIDRVGIHPAIEGRFAE